MQTNSVPVAGTCPACRDSAVTQRDVYGYARAYLCVTHRSTWDAADHHAHSSGCPWPPRGCPRCKTESQPHHLTMLSGEHTLPV